MSYVSIKKTYANLDYLTTDVLLVNLNNGDRETINRD